MYTMTESKTTNNNEKKAIKAGDYVVKLERCMVKPFTNKEGEYLNLMFRIVDGQEYANQCLFLPIFKDESGQYKFNRLSNMLETLGYKNMTFNTIEEVIKLLNGQLYLAVVKVDDNDATRNYISYFKEMDHGNPEEDPF